MCICFELVKLRKLQTRYRVTRFLYILSTGPLTSKFQPRIIMQWFLYSSSCCIWRSELCWFHRTRKGDARTSAASRSGSAYTPENGESVWGAEAQCGDVVEYPLSEAMKAIHQDGRLKGRYQPSICLQILACKYARNIFSWQPLGSHFFRWIRKKINTYQTGLYLDLSTWSILRKVLINMDESNSCFWISTLRNILWELHF